VNNYTYDGYTVSYRVADAWGDTERIAVTLTNTGADTLENWMLYFRLSTDKMAELHRQIRLNSNVLRYMIQKLDPRLEDALIANALNSNAGAREEEPQNDEAAADVYDEDDDSEDDSEE
ncbi:MAG: 30S ribosomal protein S6, partial [Thermoguttaceae bacterium]|nr:30S ribosomal protein S6 [Thermoguttaceae bacterium]